MLTGTLEAEETFPASGPLTSSDLKIPRGSEDRETCTWVLVMPYVTQ